MRFLNCFEVMKRTDNCVTISSGPPEAENERTWEALLIPSAKIDHNSGTAEVSLKALLYKKKEKIKDGRSPAPFYLRWFHQIYMRSLVVSGSQNVI